MSNQTDYFERKAYTPKYHLGDRVFGHWNKIPFVGGVGVDRILTADAIPEVVVILDLPVKYNNRFYNTVSVKHKDIKKLKSFD